jgi:hypothetical protein
MLWSTSYASRECLDALMRTVALLQCRHDSLWELEAGEMFPLPTVGGPLQAIAVVKLST